MIDGHERVENALKHADAYVPYMQVDLSPEEEAQALLSIDAMSALAETDQGSIDSLLEQVSTDDPDLAAFLASLGSGSDEHIPGYEQTRQLAPLKTVRVLVSIPIDQAIETAEIIEQLENIAGVEIDYGAN